MERRRKARENRKFVRPLVKARLPEAPLAILSAHETRPQNGD